MKKKLQENAQDLTRKSQTTIGYGEKIRSKSEQLKLPYTDFIQLFKRMVFNEFAKNYDDHTKNISFLMDKKGKWSLSPAYDVTFSYRKDNIWVKAHQMLINGKSDNITENDMLSVAEKVGIKKSDAVKCIEQVKQSVSRWEYFASQADLSDSNIQKIKNILLYHI